MSAILGTSYTSEDPDILQVESNYTALEKQLERRMANIESEYPGYDEYRYDVDTIGHDPNVLISYLTTKFNAFTPAQVQAELQALFDGQYTLTTSAVTEIRYRTVTWTDEDGVHSEPEAYEYHILYVTLRNNQLETVVSQRLTDDERPRYAATLQLKGNKPYLFGGNIYANPSEGAQYQVPGEALSDPSFAALIEEAEKYLGFPYVWAAPRRKPPSTAPASSAGSIPIPACMTCRAPRPRAFIISAPPYRLTRQSPATSSFSPRPMTAWGRCPMWASMWAMA